MLRLVMPVAHRIRRVLLAMLGCDASGVKVLAFDCAGRVLLVRHSYGRGDLYMLPGGGVGRGESPAAAARRELREETGCTARTLTLFGRYESHAERRRDTITLFHALTDDTPRPDGREVVEARFFARDALPATISPASRRRIDEAAGHRVPTSES